MKITIDTENKTISINGSANLSELKKVAKSLFGDDWKEYSIINESEYIYPHGTPSMPYYTDQYWITSGSNDATLDKLALKSMGWSVITG